MFLPSHDNQIAKIVNEFFIKPSIILLINISTSEKYVLDSSEKDPLQVLLKQFINN